MLKRLLIFLGTIISLGIWWWMLLLLREAVNMDMQNYFHFGSSYFNSR